MTNEQRKQLLIHTFVDPFALVSLNPDSWMGSNYYMCKTCDEYSARGFFDNGHMNLDTGREFIDWVYGEEISSIEDYPHNIKKDIVVVNALTGEIKEGDGEAFDKYLRAKATAKLDKMKELL